MMKENIFILLFFCLSYLCGVVQAAKYDSDIAYALGSIIIFMFFVFFCATAGPYCYKRFVKREVDTTYQPLTKRDRDNSLSSSSSSSATYVPPSVPLNDIPLPTPSSPSSSSSSSSNNNKNPPLPPKRSLPPPPRAEASHIIV